MISKAYKAMVNSNYLAADVSFETGGRLSVSNLSRPEPSVLIIIADNLRRIVSGDDNLKLI